ncbi:MAG: hypothetical protein JJT76_13615 [Clostridiaceae bacterium]|nr:hypothetical protein [Clostridiaceae bacterium]
MIKNKIKETKGFMMVFVLIITAVLIMLGTVAMTTMVNQNKLIGMQRRNEGAYASLEAGTNRFLFFLGVDPFFYRKTPNTFLEADGTLKVVEYGEGYYTVEVLKDEYPLIEIETTYYENEEVVDRLQTIFRRRNFTETLYLSNDDENVWWGSQDEMYGPVHTNGSLNIQGTPQFHGPVTYSREGGLNDTTSGANHKSIYRYHDGLPPQRIEPLLFPDVQEQFSSVDQQTKSGWHIYYGTVEIELKGTSYDIRFWENDKWGNWTYNKALPANGVIYVKNGEGQQGETPGNVYNPYISVINHYGSSREVTEEDFWNYDKKIRYTRGSQVYEVGLGEFYHDARNTRRVLWWWTNVAFPSFIPSSAYDTLKSQAEAEWNNFTNHQIKELYQNIKKSNYYGNAFISGKLDATLTIVTDNNIYIKENGVEYASIQFKKVPENPTNNQLVRMEALETRRNMLGLIANQHVYIDHHNVNNDVTIHAGIFAGESFGYEFFREKKRGTIILRGSITQNIRGPVALANNTAGFAKDYAHDPRMTNDTPPHFIEPANDSWTIIEQRRVR